MCRQLTLYTCSRYLIYTSMPWTARPLNREKRGGGGRSTTYLPWHSAMYHRCCCCVLELDGPDGQPFSHFFPAETAPRPKKLSSLFLSVQLSPKRISNGLPPNHGCSSSNGVRFDSSVIGKVLHSISVPSPKGDALP